MAHVTTEACNGGCAIRKMSQNRPSRLLTNLAKIYQSSNSKLRELLANSA